MIDYQTYCQIQEYYKQHLSFRDIAKKLSLDFRTVRKWSKKSAYRSMKKANRSQHPGHI